MEVKKSKHAQIENRRGTWLLMGFVIVLAFLFVTFEWAEYDKEIDTSMRIRELGLADDLIPITIPEEVTPPPPPPASPVVDQILIVDNETPDVATIEIDTEETGKGVEPIFIPVEVEENLVVEDEIFVHAEFMPEFEGGSAALMKYLSTYTKYPTVPLNAGVEGRVIVQFVVDKDGSITNVTVARGVDPYLDKEAIRVISAMPKWKPGKQGARAVRVKYTVPVTFKITN